MTGFASAAGEQAGYTWTWDIRAVNARGLDIRTRLPDWLDGIEDALRKALKGAVARGNVSVALKIARQDDAGALSLSPEGLLLALGHLSAISAEAEARGLQVSPISPADIAAMRGVLDLRAPSEQDNAPLIDALLAQIPDLVEDFTQSRRQEGVELGRILSAQIDEVDLLITAAEAVLDQRADARAEGLKSALRRVMENTDGADGDRVAQELAMIAVKTDVREELDRLRVHVTAARQHLQSDAPVGRKLDFLMQEFNREANTLCSKAQFNELTAIGLDLKHVIDQMREQVQNVE